jgi:hypothetical protein
MDLLQYANHCIPAVAMERREAAMGDIRDELRARLKVVEMRLDEENERYGVERRRLEAEHAHNIEALHERRKALVTIINAENEEVGAPAESRRLPEMHLSLKDYFLTLLVTRGPQAKDELKEAALLAGYFDDSSAGRVTHATIMNMASSGRLMKLPDGRYAQSNRAAGLFEPQLAVPPDESNERFEASTDDPMEAS